MLWQYERITLIKIFWRQEILLSEHNPNPVFCCHTQLLLAQWQSLLQRCLLDCVGAVRLISKVSVDWTTICRYCKFSTCRSCSCFTSSKKSLDHCVFKNILGLWYKIQRLYSPRESCSHGLQKKKSFWESHIQKIRDFIVLRNIYIFHNSKAIRANLLYLFTCYVSVFPTHNFYCITCRKILE